jgi:hypothetical protein
MFEPDDRQLLHLGKSCAGWCFLLRVYPDRGINDLSDWLAMLRGSEYGEPAKIFTEYGQVVGYNDMVETITRRAGNHKIQPVYQDDMVCLGPNNLLRYKECQGISLRVRHGPGTWDYVEGDFS